MLVAIGILLGGVTVIDTSSANTPAPDAQPTESLSTPTTPTEPATNDEADEPAGSVLFSEHSCEEDWGGLECEVTVNANYGDGVEHYLVTSNSPDYRVSSYGVEPGDSDPIWYLEPDAELIVYAVDGDDEASVIDRWTVTEDGVEKQGDDR